MTELKGVRPQLTGEVTKNRQKIGNISLWVQEDNLGGKRPAFQGNIKIDDDVSYVVLWLHGWRLVKGVEDATVVPAKKR